MKESESEAAQSWPVDCSPPSSSVHEILQARILEWVAISFSRGSSRPRDQTQVSHIAGRRFSLCTTREAKSSKLVLPVCVLSRVWLFETLWNVAHQAPLFTGFPRQEDWSGLPFPSPGAFPGWGAEPTAPSLASGFFTTEPSYQYIPWGRTSTCDPRLHCFLIAAPLSLHPFPFLISTGLNLLFGTQRRS